LPNAERGRFRRAVDAIHGLAPRTFQARLTLAFAGVVGLTLALVSVFVVNRLDDYFARQQLTELVGRSELVARYVDGAAAELVAPTGEPVVFGDNSVNPRVVALLGRPAVQRLMTDLLGQADVEIVIGLDPGDARAVVPASNGLFEARLQAEPQNGQAREPLEAGWVRYDAVSSDFPYVIEVRLSNPYTFHESAVANVTSLLAAVGVVALGLTMVVAAVTALRFTTPLRRLTEASRSLAEGDLAKRIERTDVLAGSSELAELAVQFNTMADRLEESVAIIRRDRDRSRDFLADVSHELRTPIAALLTFNELLSERAGSDPAARAEFLESSRVQLERLDWLAQNLLELSKLDSGLVLLDLRPDDLRAAIESAVEQARPSAARRDLSLRLSMPDAPVRIRHDPQRVGQIVTNLVGNAIKFTPRGGSVDVALSAVRDGARIEVSDTGVGIDAAELPKIFERFYRGSRANEARGSGSGLGLAIVRSIVDMHRGTVTVDSRLGRGSRFSVFLPRDPRAGDGDGTFEPTSEPVDGASNAAATKMADSSPTAAPSLNREASG
jgi:signal transduction histidine kinase